MFNHIVAGFDGSDVAIAAARWAADEARRRGASLSVVTCFTVPVMTDEGISDAVFGVHTLDSLRESTQRRVDELAVRLRASHPGVNISGCAVHGRARELLVGCSVHADLLVLGSSGTGESPMSMLGSLAHALMSKSACPVVLVPGVRPLPAQREIVATIDASPDWRAVVDWACDEADSLGARLTIVHGWSSQYADEKVVSEAGEYRQGRRGHDAGSRRRAGDRTDGCGRRRTACRGGRRRQDGRLRVRCRPRRRRWHRRSTGSSRRPRSPTFSSPTPPARW